MTKHETMCDTYQHKKNVSALINKMVLELLARSLSHDNSKLEPFEVDTFTEYTPRLANSTYGSEEYKQYLAEMKPALDHHYAENRHHPEHFENGILDMTLVDLVEMLCDWQAATFRHQNGDIFKSIELNARRFKYSDELKQILINTINCL